MKKIINRVVMFLFVFTICSNAVFIKPVKANPLAGATPYIISFIGSLLVSAGFQFASQADLESAVKSFLAYQAKYSPEAMDRMMMAAIANEGVQDNSVTIPVAISDLKEFFSYAVNFFNPFYKSDAGISISTAHSEIKFSNYDGFSVIDITSINTRYGASGSGALGQTTYNETKPKVYAYYESLSGYFQGQSINGGINGLNAVRSSFAFDGNKLNQVIDYTIDGIVNKSTHMEGSFTNISTSDFDSSLVYFVDASRNLKLGVVTKLDFVWKDLVSRQDVFCITREIASLGVTVPKNTSFAGSVASANVMDDTTDYGATVGAIEGVIGNTLTDEDMIGVNVLESPIGASLSDVITGVTDIPIDVPDIPEVPVIDVPASGLDLSGLQLEAGKFLTVFPFCIPHDFVSAIKAMFVTSKAPVYTMNFTGTIFGNYKMEIDLSDYEMLAQVVRWGVWISLFVGLMLSTRKFIRW